MDRWTKDEFCTSCMALVGSAPGWQTAVARILDVNDRTIRRYVSGKGPVPEWVQEELMRLAGYGARDLDVMFPRDEWIIGAGTEPENGQSRREYLFHARPPRFICRVVLIDVSTGEPRHYEEPVDYGGLPYPVDASQWLSEITWIDKPPEGAALIGLMERACDTILQYEDEEDEDYEY